MPRILAIHLDNNDFFGWNIDANVGLASPNRKPDVELVQFGYFCLARNPRSTSTIKEIAATVVPGAAYNGAPNDPLTLAILADQRARGGTQDGHISVMKGNTDGYMQATGRHGYILAFLNNNMRDVMQGLFPRIDRHTDCPTILAGLVKASFDS